MVYSMVSFYTAGCTCICTHGLVCGGPDVECGDVAVRAEARGPPELLGRVPALVQGAVGEHVHEGRGLVRETDLIVIIHEEFIRLARD